MAEPHEIVLALHESAHAAVARSLRFGDVRATVSGGNGLTTFNYPTRKAIGPLMARLVTCVAGPLAEQWVDPVIRRQCGSCSRNDFGADGRIEDELCNELEALGAGNGRDVAEHARSIARRILLEHVGWPTLFAVADHLLLHGEITEHHELLQQVPAFTGKAKAVPA